MHTDKLKYKEITDLILRGFYEVYNELGHGFLESVYENALMIVLKQYGLSVKIQEEIPVYFREYNVGNYKADMIVNDTILLELKAVRELDSAHEAQLLHYLKATSLEVGLLLNFGKKPQFKRFAFDNQRKNIRDSLRKSAAE
jgi:GxxExxY protein